MPFNRLIIHKKGLNYPYKSRIYPYYNIIRQWIIYVISVMMESDTICHTVRSSWLHPGGDPHSSNLSWSTYTYLYSRNIKRSKLIEGDRVLIFIDSDYDSSNCILLIPKYKPYLLVWFYYLIKLVYLLLYYRFDGKKKYIKFAKYVYFSNYNFVQGKANNK